MTERTFLQFRVADSVYGIPVTGVVEIIRIVGFQPIPNPAPDLLGMINVRGRIIPVFDLCRSLGIGERPLSLRMYVVIADVAGEALGVVVDDVLDVVAVPADQYQVSRALGGGDSFAAGVARLGSDLLTVLNLAPLLDRAPVEASQQEP
jgi:purine-binding chemotaxis protein CheW